MTKEKNEGKGEPKFAAAAAAAAADVILEAMIDGVSIADINGSMIQANSAFAKMLGHESQKDLIGESIVNVIAEKDIPKTMEEFKKCITIDTVMNIEFGVKRKDGSEFPCLLNGTTLKDEKGNIVGLIGTLRDITEFKRAQQREKELAAAAAAAAAAGEKRRAEEWARTFDSILDLICIEDKDFTITRVNKAFAEALKSKPEDIVGKKCYEVLHKSDKPWPDCPFEKLKKDKQPHTQEVDDPNIGIPLLISVSPLLDDKGEVVGCVHIARDISAIKQAEKELVMKMQALERFHNVTIGRELEMVELKREVNSLLEKLGQPRKYEAPGKIAKAEGSDQ